MGWFPAHAKTKKERYYSEKKISKVELTAKKRENKQAKESEADEDKETTHAGSQVGGTLHGNIRILIVGACLF